MLFSSLYTATEGKGDRVDPSDIEPAINYKRQASHGVAFFFPNNQPLVQTAGSADPAPNIESKVGTVDSEMWIYM